MSGLREKKKLSRQKRIEDSALKLFDSIGFEAATMEKIAEEADLGVGTLYNYYSSKADILMGIIAKRVVPYEAELKAVREKETMTVNEAFYACIDIYMKSFSFFSRRIWREFTATVLSKGLPLFFMVRNVDEVFIESLESLVINFRNKGAVNCDVSERIAAETLYSILFYHIMYFISDDNLSLQDAEKMTGNLWNTVIAGFIKI